MKKFNQDGIILYKTPQDFEIINNHITKYRNKGSIIKEITLGHVRTIPKKNWNIFILRREAFNQYKWFDDCLLTLGDESKNNNNILVIGHSDQHGYFWTDYENNEVENNEN
jgi:hypothetical protein